MTKQIGIADKAFFWWRTSHDGLRDDQAKRLRDPKGENARPAKAVT